MTRIGGFVVAVAVGLLAVVAAPATAQAPPAITPSFDGSAAVPPTTAIELRLSRPLPPTEGRLAVFIGTTDLTALFTAQSDLLAYQPSFLPLPLGANEVIVSLVTSADSWTEIGRFPLRVEAPSRWLESDFGVGVGVDLKGQAAEGHALIADLPLRDQFQDLVLNIHEHSAHVTSTWGVRTLGNFLAASYRPEALRYPELGDAAPLFDLSDYLITGELGGGKLSVGHISFGENRLLLSNFASRGVMAAQKLGPAKLALGAMNATSIVGWDNPTGLNNPDHQLVAGELGLEAMPSRPGALGAQVSVLDGSQLPIVGYNQGAVTDAEESRGVGFHLSASDNAQRVRVDAGYARSEFTTPDDPFLSQGFTLLAVPKTTSNARYADVTVDVLRSLSVAPTVAATLQTTYRHERVDPLYRSVGSLARSDFLQNGVEVLAGAGPVSVQGSYSRGHDNLADVVSLLTTMTRTTTANVAIPLAPLMAAPTSPWLPVISYQFMELHQYSDQLPPNSVFSLSDVPDQVSTNHGLDAQWSSSIWHAGYQLSRTLQDNRQLGHEAEDFTSLTHAVSLGVTPAAAIDLSVELAFEHSRNEALPQDLRTKRLSGLANWRITRSTALAVIGSASRTVDDDVTNEQKNTDLEVELSQRISLMRIASLKPSGQFFVRYSRRTGDLIIPGMPTLDPRRNWTINTGVALSVF